MEKSVKVSEDDLSIIKNKIMRHIEFLNNSVDAYTEILTSIRENALEITATVDKFPKIADELRTHVSQVTEECNALNSILRNFTENVESVDKFDYPNAALYEISSFLANLF